MHGYPFLLLLAVPRPGEIEGVHYFFLDTDHFKSLVEQDGFLEWAQVHDNYYGT